MSGAQLPQQIDSDAPVFVISVAAQLAGMHPQTLRTYDRMGLVVPRRLAKRGRRYSARDIARSWEPDVAAFLKVRDQFLIY